ncbi:MAG: serine hydrolase domain-containing protein [Pseudomonadales bacterium]
MESGDGGFRWFGAAGTANDEGAPLTAATPFHIASIDKLMVATLVMKLREHGSITLDDAIGSYLPRTLIGGLHQLNGVDHTGAITIRHLLGHTSGLADCFEDRPKGGRSLMERLFAEGDMAWSINHLTMLVRRELRPHFPPQAMDAKRQKARYSSTNYQLLIALIETITRQPLHQALAEWLFRPLQLQHTYLFGRAPPSGPTLEAAPLYLHGQPLNLPLALRSFPSIYSTTGDLLAFLRALTSGAIFDDEHSLPLMQQRWNRFGFPLDAAALRSPGWPIEYGLGMLRFRLPRALTPLRRMPALIGHTGSTGSWLLHCPERDLLLCGTVNEASAGAVPYRFVPAQVRAVER